MSGETTDKCPVCGRARSDSSDNDFSCSSCGFEFAFTDRFAGPSSREQWLALVSDAKGQRLRTKREILSDGSRFILTDSSAAYISKERKELFVVNSDGSLETHKGVVHYSSNGRNTAFVNEDGSVRVTGDNTYRQCKTDDLKGVVKAACSSDCIYALTANGEVFTSGVSHQQISEEWNDVTMIDCGSFHVLGLTSKGTALISGDMPDRAMVEKVGTWKNIRQISASTDCSLALLKDGTVSFAGRDNDRRKEAESWTDIVSLDADNSYAVGLTSDGQVKLAGYIKPYLEMGRSSAAEWENMIAISCSTSGIAGIDSNGKLSITGGFSGDLDSVIKTWNERIAEIIVSDNA